MGPLHSDRTSIIYRIDSTRLPRSQNGPWASPNAKSGLASLGEAEALPLPAPPVTLRFHACFQLWPDRPNPQSQSFPEVSDPACRLPTLFYWPEAVHLGDLLRLWVRPEARVYTRHPDFQGPAGATPDAAPDAALYGAAVPHLRSSRLQANPPLTKKRQLFLGLRPASPGSIASQLWPSRGGKLRLQVREYRPDSLSTRGRRPTQGRPAPPLRAELP